MDIRLLSKEDIAEIKQLYADIKKNSFTAWSDAYPSEELICYDIERKGLWGVFSDDELIAISFAGQRCEDNEENFTWREDIKKRGTFARIGVSPKYQNRGIGSMLVKFILEKLKSDGFDGVRILVDISNLNAIKLYQKFGFKNCGIVTRENQKYFLFELKFD